MNIHPRQPGLLGLQVFIVEDEALLALLLEDMLGELGCVVHGVAHTVNQALDQLASIPPPAAAILDVHLRGELSFPVADLLKQRNVPFVFSTGYSSSNLDQRYRNIGILHKPYGADTLAAALAALVLAPAG
jgi:CheY-like chemotaxis protein